MIEVHSRTWEIVNARARVLIAEARSRLEKPGLDPVTTEYERGKIAALNSILSLAHKVAEPRLVPLKDSDAGY